MILSLAAAEDSITAAVNRSMLARTPSTSGNSLSNSSTGKGPGFGGIINSQLASRISCSADAPTSFIVRAVISTFQDMVAESSVVSLKLLYIRCAQIGLGRGAKEGVYPQRYSTD